MPRELCKIKQALARDWQRLDEAQTYAKLKHILEEIYPLYLDELEQQLEKNRQWQKKYHASKIPAGKFKQFESLRSGKHKVELKLYG